jgi:hypothetical protein
MVQQSLRQAVEPTSGQAPVQDPVGAHDEAPDFDLAQDTRGRRGPTLAVAAAGVAWLTMAVVGVTMLRPELGMVKQIAVKAAIDGIPAAVAPAAYAKPPQQRSPGPQTSPSAPVTGWWRYTDPTGFSINLPDGWKQDYRSANQVRFTNTAVPGAAIVIAYTTTPQPDQYLDWEQQSAWKAETDPAYLLFGIHRVSYRGYNSANWEFTDSENGRLTHFLDHGFISAPGAQAYSIELIAPASQWNSIQASLWGELLASFTPARHSSAAMPESPARRSQPVHGSAQPQPTPATAGMQSSSRPPAGQPTSSPSGYPTGYPTSTPTSIPTSIPTGIPTSIPTGYPTSIPSSLPTSIPSSYF